MWNIDGEFMGEDAPVYAYVHGLSEDGEPCTIPVYDRLQMRQEACKQAVHWQHDIVVDIVH